MDREDILVIIQTALTEKSKSLDLSNKDIRELPPDIGLLTELEHLDLSYNYIGTIPAEIGNLKNLKTLLLLRNEISQIPPEMGKLINLTLLDISHNRFTDLPPEIGKLQNLRTLDASYGELRRLPIEFIELLSLKELYLEENMFEFPPSKVVKRGLYATMHFLTSEKKKRDASRVMLQVFNMPDSLHDAFRQYVSFFKDMVSVYNENEIKIETSFIRHDFDYPNIEMQVGVENYLYELLDFIRERIEQLKSEKLDGQKVSLLDIQLSELSRHIKDFNSSLDEKLSDIHSIRQEINSFYKLLEKKKEL